MTATLNRRQLLGGTAAALGMTAAGIAAARPASAANWKIVPHEHQWQETGYWCGPAATRVALSCRGVHISQADLAAQLGTHTGGTDHIGQVTNVLNNHVGGYGTTELPNDPPNQAQRDKLWQDLVRNVDNGRGLVANIVAPPSNRPPGYPADQTIYHYFTAVGYNPDTSQVYVADSAQFSQGQYWLSFEQFATLIPPKGYSG